MKKVLLIASLVCASFALTQKSDAQIRFGFNINVGDQPAWRTPGYNYVEYYYLPDIEAYYYVPRHQFVYMDNGRWVFSSSLPYRYRDYNLYNARKVVVNRHNAYLNFDMDRNQYGRRNDFDRRDNDRFNRNDRYNRNNRRDNDRDHDNNRRNY